MDYTFKDEAIVSKILLIIPIKEIIVEGVFYQILSLCDNT